MAADTLLSLIEDPTVRTVAAGAGLLGAVTAAAGAFCVVRRQSLQGDVVAHAALPGVMIAFVAGSRSAVRLTVGGADG